MRHNWYGDTLLSCSNTIVLELAIKQAGIISAMNSQGLYIRALGQLGNLYTVTVFWCGAQLVRILSATGTSTVFITV